MIQFAIYPRQSNSVSGQFHDPNAIIKTKSLHGNGFYTISSIEELEDSAITLSDFAFIYNKYADKKIKKFADRKSAAKRLFNLLNEKLIESDYSEMELYKEKVPVTKSKVSKPRGQFAGKMIRLLVDENPRKEGTHGHNSFNVIAKHGADMPYEFYIKSGGRLNDLKWDIDRKWAEIYYV